MGNFLGAIVGDMMGSTYEWNNAQTNQIDYFRDGSKPTDDSVLSCAVAEWLMEDENFTNEVLAKKLREFANAFPDAGYGSKFRKWLKQDNDEPIGSWGNGSAMRCSAIGYFAKNFEQCLELAEKSAVVTHNHPDAVNGAKAIALGVYMASIGNDMDEIKEAIENQCGYDLSKKLTDFVRADNSGAIYWRAHKFDASCKVTVPEAIIAFLNSDSYEDAVTNAILIGGDSDTIADMAGALAGAYYGVPQMFQNWAIERLPEKLFNTVVKFNEFLDRRTYKLMKDE